MLIPDQAIPTIFQLAPDALGAVCYALAFDPERVEKFGFADAFRDGMMPNNPPAILKDALSWNEADPEEPRRRTISLWNASAGFDIVLQIIQDESEVEAWIVINRDLVLYTLDVRSRRFSAMIQSGSEFQYRDR